MKVEDYEEAKRILQRIEEIAKEKDKLKSLIEEIDIYIDPEVCERRKNTAMDNILKYTKGDYKMIDYIRKGARKEIEFYEMDLESLRDEFYKL